jgi:hypothetical protein
MPVTAPNLRHLPGRSSCERPHIFLHFVMAFGFGKYHTGLEGEGKRLPHIRRGRRCHLVPGCGACTTMTMSSSSGRFVIKGGVVR